MRLQKVITTSVSMNETSENMILTTQKRNSKANNDNWQIHVEALKDCSV